MDHAIRVCRCADDRWVAVEVATADDIDRVRELAATGMADEVAARLAHAGVPAAVVRRADELVTDDFVDHQAVPGLPTGREGFKMLNAMFRSAFPDVAVTCDGIVADDDTVSCRWTSTGTHKGDLFGIAPTGKKIKVTATVWYRVRDGRLAEGWISRDDFGMMRQLGVIPTP